MSDTLATEILAALPQTQCTRCGYPNCAAYAQAIAQGEAAINQCPPGGTQGIKRLAAITGLPATALNPANGLEGPRAVAVIDENWCIGCTLCIYACPTDAILGSNKLMHTVIEPHCTGCELCIPVCPVDCISLENVTGTSTGWGAWSSQQANAARERYDLKSYRFKFFDDQRLKKSAKPPAKSPGGLPATSRLEDTALLEKKRSVVEAALARAKYRADLARPGPPRTLP